MSEQINSLIHEQFEILSHEVDNIINSNLRLDKATKEIVDHVSRRLTTKSDGYISSLYTQLSKKTLQDPIFQKDENINQFYELHLRNVLIERYQLDIKTLASWKNGKGIDFKEVNSLYTSAAATAGGAGIVGILLGVLSKIIDIPLVVVIAGAVLAGLGSGAYTYTRYVPEKNKKLYKHAVHNFMNSLERDMIAWMAQVEKYYDEQVEMLKKDLLEKQKVH